jgi:hypothetical protein
MIKKISKELNLIYPKNDIEAYTLYPKYNIVYNKLEIAKFQNLNCNPLPILPNKYPIIIKPIINLLGMGLNAKKIKTEKQLDKYLTSGFFWCEYLDGKHYSWDLIIREGKIIYYTTFQGYKKTFGTFSKWIEEKREMIEIIEKIIEYYLIDFTGSVNIETLNDKIIEVHLRLGDIDFSNDEIIKLALLNINKLDISQQLKIVMNLEFKPLYLIPLWQKLDKITDIKKTFKIIKKFEKEIINNDLIRGYYLDDLNHPNPDKYKRLLLLIGYNQKEIYKLINKIKKNLK